MIIPTSWSFGDIMKLLDVWNSSLVELRKAKRNGHVYEAMSLKLKDLGVKVTPNEIRVKINNLTQRYRCEKKIVDPSGGSLSSWTLYQSVHEIIGGFICNDTNTMHGSINDENAQNSAVISVDTESGGEPGTSAGTSRASSSATGSIVASHPKRKKMTFRESVLDEMQKTRKMIEDDIKDTKQLLEEANKRDQIWFEMTKEFLKSSLDLQQNQTDEN